MGRFRRPTLAAWISLACLLGMAPLLGFSTWMLYREVSEQQRQGLRALELRASRAAVDIGHELDAVAGELDVLTLAETTHHDGLAAAYATAQRLVQTDRRISSIAMSGPSGELAFDTSHPFGSRLPRTSLQESLQPLFVGRPRFISPLIPSGGTDAPVLVVATRADLGAQGVYALQAAIRLEAISDRFRQQAWPADWTAAVIDQNGIIIARSRDAARFVGQPATPGLLASLQRGEGVFHAVTKDGTESIAQGAAIPGTGWYVVVGRPAQALRAQVRDSLTALLGVGALCAALGVAGAAYVSRTMGSQLRRTVDRHVRGQGVQPSGIAIREVADIHRMLEQARQQVETTFTEVVTARESALTELREKEEMLSVLAHEVRQPLNNASAALQEANAVLEKRVAPELRSPLSRANRVLSEVTGSIDNTLAVAALLVGGRHVRRVDFDIDTLVGVTLGDLPAGEVGRVKVQRATSTRTASMEPSLMRLALRNLLSNALKFSPPDSPVVLRIADSEEPLAVIFDVIDSGGGIEPALLPRLFSRGERKDMPLGGRRQGLGLYIVSEVMRLHRGSVALVRNEPDGTTMRLTIVQTEEE